MTTPLKDAVRAHVESQSLDDEQLAHLNALLEAPPAPRRARWPLAMLALACAVLLAIGFWAWRAPDSRLDAIAAEVARNHVKLKPLEVEAETVPEVQPFFASLEFRLVSDSKLLTPKPLRLRGGRFCSIQGEDAAQLRYARGEETVSVYMAPYDPGVMGRVPDIDRAETPARVRAAGLDVLIWVEHGVLMAATPAP